MKPTTVALIIFTLMISIRSYSQLSIPFEKYTLPNGLEVILHEDHSVPIVAVNIWYHVGAAREQKGRTGFAHLFEHLMYEGSEHVRDGLYDEIVDGSGGSNNGSTGFDRTNYWLVVPKNYVEPALWLESDRMGFLLPGITQERLDLQRDVVKNERRQSYENQPYGQAFVKLFEAMYPDGIPYHWLPIGSQEDLTAASLEDVKGFFTTYYGPNNASLSIGGDFATGEMKKLVEKYFGGIQRGPAVPKPVPIKTALPESRHLLLEDKVQLPRLYMMWHTTPGYAVDDAELALLGYIMSVGKNSRLYKSMVYENQVAQDVSASQDGSELSGLFIAVTTAKPGHGLDELKTAILGEIRNIAQNGVTDRELQRAKNGLRSGFIYQLQNIGGFGGKTDILNQYNVMLGDPGKLSEDLQRYERVTVEDIKRVAATYLLDKASVSLSIVPEGKAELQAKP
jgi:zinc protease